MKILAPIAARNIIAQAAGRRPSNVIPLSMTSLSMISLGPRDAIVVVNGMAILSHSAGA